MSDGGRFRVGWATIGDTAEPSMPDFPPGSRYFMTDGWSPDGQHLICMSGEWQVNVDLVAWSHADGWINLTNSPGIDEIWPNVSPDGRWLAYVARDDAGESRVFVRPFLRDGPAVQVSTTDSSAPLWSHDGTELFYISAEQVPGTMTREGDSAETPHWVMAAAVTDRDSGIEIGRPVRLFSAEDYVRLVPVRSWDIGPDGRFLMTRRPSDEVVREAMDAFFPDRIRFIQNWASTLEERSP